MPNSELMLVRGLAILLASAAAFGQPSFRGLGFTPGTNGSTAYAVSADGSTVVGVSGYEAFRWRADTGIVGLGHLAPPYDGESVAFAVSGDGSIIVGCDTDFSMKGFPTYAFRWTLAEGMAPLGPAPPPGTLSGSGAYGISPDGAVIVGYADRGDGVLLAFRWTAPTGLVTIPQTTEAWDVSAGGDVVVGRYRAMAFRYTPGQGAVSLGDLPGGAVGSRAHAVCADGSVVVGDSLSGNSDPPYEGEAFRWTAATGMIGLGDLPGGSFASRALAVSADGTVVVGHASDAVNLYVAFIWDADHGMRDLKLVLETDYGLSLTGWHLPGAYGISADGRTIVGTGGNPMGQSEAWLAYLGPPCPADWNHSGAINSQDFFDFLVAFFAGALSADFNHDNHINSQDFFDYLAAFFAGCP